LNSSTRRRIFAAPAGDLAGGATAAAVRAYFRTDLCRANPGPIGADPSGASEKIESAPLRRTPVASSTGEMLPGIDCLFDGRQFDPD